MFLPNLKSKLRNKSISNKGTLSQLNDFRKIDIRLFISFLDIMKATAWQYLSKIALYKPYTKFISCGSLERRATPLFGWIFVCEGQPFSYIPSAHIRVVWLFKLMWLQLGMEELIRLHDLIKAESKVPKVLLQLIIPQ